MMKIKFPTVKFILVLISCIWLQTAAVCVNSNETSYLLKNPVTTVIKYFDDRLEAMALRSTFFNRGTLPWIGYNHAPILCSTNGSQNTTIPSMTDSYYYFIVAQIGGWGGSYGGDF